MSARSYAAGGALTPRMVAVLELKAAGLTDREVGVRLVVATSTVKAELSAAYVRLHARSAIHAYAIARDRGDL
jgi:DNA-binding NarL/FixJ family response regulator